MYSSLQFPSFEIGFDPDVSGHRSVPTFQGRWILVTFKEDDINLHRYVVITVPIGIAEYLKRTQS